MTKELQIDGTRQQVKLLYHFPMDYPEYNGLNEQKTNTVHLPLTLCQNNCYLRLYHYVSIASEIKYTFWSTTVVNEAIIRKKSIYFNHSILIF